MALRDWIAKAAGALRPRAATDVSNLTPAEFAKLLDSWGVLSTASGIAVTPEIAARAIPVKASCTVIAGGLISMPLRVYTREVLDGQFVKRPDDNHAYWWLLNEQPNPDETAASMWQRVVWDLLLRARSYVRIVRAGNGKTNLIGSLRYHRVCDVNPVIQWDPAQRVRRITSYQVTEDGHTFGVVPEDMLHFRGEVSQQYPDRSAQLEAARESIAILLSIEQYAGGVFRNGGTPRINLQYPAGVTLTDEQVRQLRSSWLERYAGGDNAALPLVLTNGGTANKLNWTAEELQMLQAWTFQVINIARAFNVPPFMIGETEKTSSWGSGIEQMSKGFVRYTLGPTITGIEQELNRKIFRTLTRFVDFDEEALDKGDMKSLGDWYRQAVGGSQGPGFMTVNEVRRRMNLPPIDGGDEIYDPKNGGTNAAPGAASADAGNAGTEPGQAAAV